MNNISMTMTAILFALLPSVRHQSVQARTPSLRTRNPHIRVFLHDFQTSLFGKLVKF